MEDRAIRPNISDILGRFQDITDGVGPHSSAMIVYLSFRISFCCPLVLDILVSQFCLQAWRKGSHRPSSRTDVVWWFLYVTLYTTHIASAKYTEISRSSIEMHSARSPGVVGWAILAHVRHLPYLRVSYLPFQIETRFVCTHLDQS
jgi:hypothetical protein